MRNFTHPPAAFVGLLSAALAVLALTPAASAADAPGAGAAKDAATSDAPADSTGRLFHVVSFKFKPSATPEQIATVEQAFKALKEKIPFIVSLSWGTNVSTEKHDHGYTHCWVLTFNNAKDRDAYLVHPAHKEFGGIAGPSLGEVFVVDFWERK